MIVIDREYCPAPVSSINPPSPCIVRHSKDIVTIGKDNARVLTDNEALRLNFALVELKIVPVLKDDARIMPGNEALRLSIARVEKKIVLVLKDDVRMEEKIARDLNPIV